MKIDFNKKKVDKYNYDVEWQLKLTASEYLILITAIRQFAENSANHSDDIEIAKSVIAKIEKDIKESEE